MDNYEAVYTLNRDKAISLLNAADNFVIFFITSFISVFIPLAYTISEGSQVMMLIFLSFIKGSLVVTLPLFVFFFAKYREYKYQYKKVLIKSIVDNISGISNPGSLTYHDVCTKITHITDFEYREVMTLLLKIYPPENSIIKTQK